MKVLMLNGSAKANGNTYSALLEIGKQLEKEGIEYEIFQLGKENGIPLPETERRYSTNFIR